MASTPIPASAFRRFANAPLLLLILSGTLVGSMLPMNRIAGAAGWSALAFAFWPALGSGLVLTAVGCCTAGRAPVSRPVLLYSLVAGALSVAIPNSITFFVMPELGTSLTSLMYTLAPLFTYAFAWILGIERYQPLRLAGIVLGLGGAALLVLGRSAFAAGPAWWIGLALCAPVSLALGNLYRKQRMPRGVHSSALAGGMLLGAALALAPLLLANGGLLPAGRPEWSVIVMQCVFTSVGYMAYFRFQKVADPVYFSQIGYVISATGVCSGLLLFNERLTVLMLAAIAAIVAGVALVNGRAPGRRESTDNDGGHETRA